MKNTARVVWIAALLLTLLAGIARPAYAAETVEDGTVEASQTVNDDLFLSGDTVVMDGTVNGLLFAAGDTVTINGTVNGDAFLFGKTILVTESARVKGNLFLGSRTGRIEGKISGSLLGGAGSLVLAGSSSIDRNLYFGGYNLETAPGSSIARDVFAGGYQALLNGDVERDAFVASGALELSGSIGRDLQLKVGSTQQNFTPMWSQQVEGLPDPVSPGLRIDEKATIDGKLVYTSETEQRSAIQAQPSGGLVYQTPVPNENENRINRTPAVVERYPVLEWIYRFVRNLVTLLAFGALALWLVPAVFQRTVDQARQQPGPSAGYGLLAIFSGYFSALVAVVVILLLGLLLGLLSLGGLVAPVYGIGFSALALLFSIFSFLIVTGSKLIVAYLVGLLLIERAAPQTQNRVLWAMISGVAIYVLVTSLPLVGLVTAIIATLIGMGAIWLAYQAWRAPAAA